MGALFLHEPLLKSGLGCAHKGNHVHANTKYMRSSTKYMHANIKYLHTSKSGHQGSISDLLRMKRSAQLSGCFIVEGLA